jgi:transcriptional regulator with XRE-family HTH domain
MSNATASHPRLLLKEALATRSRRNPRYSLRAFAQAMGISHTVLSLFLTGKRPLSRKAAEKAADFLGLDPTDRARFIANRAGAALDETQYDILTHDSFEVLSDPQSLSILSLLEIPGERFEPTWIARRLGISQTQAKLAIERLQRLGLVTHRDDGTWKQSRRPIRVTKNLSTPATRRFHQELLTLATERLETTPVELRDYSSITFALDPALVPYALERIRDFRRALCEELESMGKPQEVYHLSVQLFPTSQSPKTNTADRSTVSGNQHRDRPEAASECQPASSAAKGRQRMRRRPGAGF